MTTWLSIIIPARGKPAEVWFTLQSLLYEDLDGVEIIVVDNDPLECRSTPQPATRPTVSKVCSHIQKVKYVEATDCLSPYHPRNVGYGHASGEWLLFLDSHVMLRPGSIRALRVQTTNPRYPDYTADDKSVSPVMVHFPVAFDNQATWFGHYKLTIETDFWGKWGPKPKDGLPYPIGASGIWAFLTRRKDYAAVDGFNKNFAGYGGGEVYLQLKYWLMGGGVFMDPNIRGVHWSGPRDYAIAWPERCRNVALAATVVAGGRFDELFLKPLLAHFGKHMAKNSVDEMIWKGMRDGVQEMDWLREKAPLNYAQVMEKWAKDRVAVS